LGSLTDIAVVIKHLLMTTYYKVHISLYKVKRFITIFLWMTTNLNFNVDPGIFPPD